MKNLLEVLLLLCLWAGFSSCKDVVAPLIEVPVVLKKGISAQKNEPDIMAPKNLISRYSVLKTFEDKLVFEVEILFEYDKKGNLLATKRLDKSYNSKTQLLADESFTNRFLTYDENGMLNQMKIYNSESLKYNSYSIHDFVSVDGLFTAIDFTIIKDDKVVMKIPNNFKLNYNDKKQLVSYQSGNDKGHDFIYLNDIHVSSFLKNVSNYDFEYSSALHPSSDYDNAVKYVVNQAVDLENAKGFGIVSRYQPSRIINKSGGLYEFTTKTNSAGFPIEIIETDFQKNEAPSKFKISTKIEYVVF